MGKADIYWGFYITTKNYLPLGFQLFQVIIYPTSPLELDSCVPLRFLYG
jgi:hypothetical protein